MASTEQSLLMGLPDELLIKISDFVDCGSILNWTLACRTLSNAGAAGLAKHKKRTRKYRQHHVQSDDTPLSIVKMLRLIIDDHAATEHIHELHLNLHREDWSDWLDKSRMVYTHVQQQAPVADSTFFGADELDKFCNMLNTVLPSGRAMVRQTRKAITEGDDRPLKLLCTAMCPNLKRLNIHTTIGTIRGNQLSLSDDGSLVVLITTSILQHTQLGSTFWPPGLLYLQHVDISIDNKRESGLNSNSILLLLLLPQLKKLVVELSYPLAASADSSESVLLRDSAVEELTLRTEYVKKTDVRDVLRRCPRLRTFHIASDRRTVQNALECLPLYQKDTLVDLSIDGFNLSRPGFEGAHRIELDIFKPSHTRQLTALKTLKGFPASMISRHYDRLEHARQTQYGGWHETILNASEDEQANTYLAGFDSPPADAMDIDDVAPASSAGDAEWYGVADLRTWLPNSLEELELRFDEKGSTQDKRLELRRQSQFRRRGSTDINYHVNYNDDMPYIRALGRRVVQFVQAGSKLKKIVLDRHFNIEKIDYSDQEVFREAGVQLMRGGKRDMSQYLVYR